MTFLKVGNLPAELQKLFLIPTRFSSTKDIVDQDESQMEEEAGSPPQAQEKKDESSIQINTSHLNLT
ncbi:zeta toxin [Fusarium austroafricanum]|uniref:Zeta toxin n=1 Tax=Fusarium austroafricanum TaxID=2364996 RepID=A0A8H4KBF3_9HYPO|nr:zeta toxin [Fusarium austroafricanum]